MKTKGRSGRIQAGDDTRQAGDDTRRVIEQIACQHLGFETLDERKSDSLDFRDVSVWSVEAALRAAYEAGAASVSN